MPESTNDVKIMTKLIFFLKKQQEFSKLPIGAHFCQKADRFDAGEGVSTDATYGCICRAHLRGTTT